MTDDEPDLRQLLGRLSWEAGDAATYAVRVLRYARDMRREAEAKAWLAEQLPKAIQERGHWVISDVLAEFSREFGPPGGEHLPPREVQRPREFTPPPMWADKILPRLLIDGGRPLSVDDLRASAASHWEWMGARKSDSGQPIAPPLRGDRSLPVVRVLWAALQGGLPVDRVVRVTCGTDGCVNPSHGELVRRGSWLRG